MATLDKKNCKYAACYCEENVYHLCATLVESGQAKDLDKLFVIFISNPNKKVPLFRQQASTAAEGLVVWDYHVLLVQLESDAAASKGPQPQALVWDLDTTLPFPCEGTQYAKEALQATTLLLPPDFARFYRVVPALLYLEYFCSDRSHMKVPPWRPRAPHGFNSDSSKSESESGGGCDEETGGYSWSSPPPPWPPIQPKNSCGVPQHNLPCYWSLDPSLCCGTQALQETLQGRVQGGANSMLQHLGKPSEGQSEQKGPFDDFNCQRKQAEQSGHGHQDFRESRYGLVVSELDFLRFVLRLHL
uniref:Protein N-terminal glutamine amidohydrolase n=1 Tax=Dunaliella tertiolecta TaxID=3047 RepID=A0A7S3QTK5_DUNTE|mmetsp:Transcript_6739/g.18050  ORF Transcript_6739/g.18050 Transcript_6739/m.18050 type:complete len:302 (+) Transcript_6739:64-969(+)